MARNLHKLSGNILKDKTGISVQTQTWFSLFTYLDNYFLLLVHMAVRIFHNLLQNNLDITKNIFVIFKSVLRFF
jgi:hypothetical protein